MEMGMIGYDNFRALATVGGAPQGVAIGVVPVNRQELRTFSLPQNGAVQGDFSVVREALCRAVESHLQDNAADGKAEFVQRLRTRLLGAGVHGSVLRSDELAQVLDSVEAFKAKSLANRRVNRADWLFSALETRFADARDVFDKIAKSEAKRSAKVSGDDFARIVRDYRETLTSLTDVELAKALPPDAPIEFGAVAQAMGRAVARICADERVAKNQSKGLAALTGRTRMLAQVLTGLETPSTCVQGLKGRKRGAFLDDVLRLKTCLASLKPGGAECGFLSSNGTPVTLYKSSANMLELMLGGQRFETGRSPEQLLLQIENDMLLNADVYGRQEVRGLFPAGYGRVPETVENAGRLREMSLIVLGKMYGIVSGEVPNASLNRLVNLARNALEGVLDGPDDGKVSAATLHDSLVFYLNDGTNDARVNSAEASEVLRRHEEALVQEAQEQPAEPPPEEEEPSGFFGGFFKSVGSAFGNLFALVKPDSPTTTTDVQKCLVDFIYNDESWMFDRDLEQGTGTRLRELARRHPVAFAAILNGDASLQQLLREITPDEEAIGGVLDDLAAIRAKMGGRAALKITSAMVLKFLDTAEDADFIDAERSLDAVVAKVCNNLQDALNEQMGVRVAEQDGHRVIEPRAAGRRAEAAPANPAPAPNRQPTLKELDARIHREMQEMPYAKLVRQVFGTYFTNMPAIDKRSIIAAGLRARAEGLSPEENRKRVFAALFKGAGPLMQKLLQGMADDEGALKDVIADMKNNLRAIPPRMVDAQLRDIVARSNGRIESLTVERPLGAASVGQAFLCRMRVKGEVEPRACVVKLLRPDAANRVQRERKLFEDAAKLVGGGTEETFNGWLKGVLDEFDLTIEAKNIRLGQVYDKSPFKDVGSMKLSDCVDPTATSMVLELAPGQTLLSFQKDVERRLDEFDKANKVETPPKSGKYAWDREKLPDAKQLVDLQRSLTEMYEELREAQHSLINLTKAWTHEALYGSGFYHGDLHSANIMFSSGKRAVDAARLQELPKGTSPSDFSHKRLTVIDFGNATVLTPTERANVDLMMSAALYSNTDDFIAGFRGLLPPEGRDRFDAVDRSLKELQPPSSIHDRLREILHAGRPNDVGQRILLALKRLQALGVEVPPAIEDFSKSQQRLSNSIDSINATMERISREIDDLARFVNDASGEHDLPIGTNEYVPGDQVLSGKAVVLFSTGVSDEDRTRIVSNMRTWIETLDNPNDGALRLMLLGGGQEKDMTGGVASESNLARFEELHRETLAQPEYAEVWRNFHEQALAEIAKRKPYDSLRVCQGQSQRVMLKKIVAATGSSSTAAVRQLFAMKLRTLAQKAFGAEPKDATGAPTTYGQALRALSLRISQRQKHLRELEVNEQALTELPPNEIETRRLMQPVLERLRADVAADQAYFGGLGLSEGELELLLHVLTNNLLATRLGPIDDVLKLVDDDALVALYDAHRDAVDTLGDLGWSTAVADQLGRLAEPGQKRGLSVADHYGELMQTFGDGLDELLDDWGKWPKFGPWPAPDDAAMRQSMATLLRAAQKTYRQVVDDIERMTLLRQKTYERPLACADAIGSEISDNKLAALGQLGWKAPKYVGYIVGDFISYQFSRLFGR